MTSLSLLTLSGLALAGGDHKVDVCHRGLTLNVDAHAVKAHLGHGDTLPADWYADGDGDGFGDDGEAVTACEAPYGYVSTPGDCDDADATRNPNAEELCGDGIDQDCDGLIDDADPDATCGSCPLGPRTESVLSAHLAVVSPYSFPGSGLTSADVDGDGRMELILNHADIVWAAPVSRDATSTFADADLIISRGPYFGAVTAGDVDGDGQDDLLLGRAANGSPPGALARVHLVLGPISGAFDLANAAATWTGETFTSPWGSLAGSDIALVGDHTGDGVNDIAISDGNAYNFNGAMYVVSGADRGTRSLATAVARRVGSYGDRIIHLAGPVDVDGDGDGDVVGSAYGDVPSHPGRVYVESGPVGGFSSAASMADHVLSGEAAQDHAGYQVSGAGDVDGDGVDDLILGAVGLDVGGPTAGGAYVVAAPPTGGSSLADAHARLIGHYPGGATGIAVAGLGDVDGDGLGDVAVAGSIANACGAYSGVVYLVSGPSGDVHLADADRIIVGEPGDQLTESLHAADLDGDGHTDLAFTSWGPLGRVWVLWGPLL